MLTECYPKPLLRDVERAWSPNPPARSAAVVQPCTGIAGRDAAALLAQERLLREESDHRLGNFLQIVASNLTREALRAADPAARSAFDAAAGQLQTLGTLHRTLGGALAGNSEDCESAVRALCGTLQSFVVAPRGHTLRFEVRGRRAGAALPPDAVRCLTLLVSELVVNAAKHAFAARAAGRIDVVLAYDAGTVVCTVRDNGSGEPPDGRSGGSQGMRLAQRLAEQAGGHCRWVFGGSGTEARIALPVETPVAPRAPQPLRPVQRRPGLAGFHWPAFLTLALRGAFRAAPQPAISGRCEFR